MWPSWETNLRSLDLQSEQLLTALWSLAFIRKNLWLSVPSDADDDLVFYISINII